MRRRRGFTLVEVLVALGLLVLIASLALPVALTNTAGARATTAQRVLTLAPDAARGQARRLGTPVALVLLPTEDGQSLRLAMVREPDPASDSAADRAADPDDIATWPTVDDPAELPEGTRLWTGREAALTDLEARGEPLLEATLGGQGGQGAGPMDAAESVAAEPVAPVVLAWFLSDGSAMAGQATVLRLADGRIVRARVEALVGRLVFTAAPELAGLGEDAETEPEPDPEAGEPMTPPGDEPPLEPAGEPGDEPSFDPLEFESMAFEGPAFEPLGFEEMRFEALEFEALEFEDLAFERLVFEEPGNERDAEDEQADAPSERTNPEPPQPR
jgi:prepilin-type N-terminal cleavage/methylation domain-containing protein